MKEQCRKMSRREMLALSRNGFGAIALMGMFGGCYSQIDPEPLLKVANTLSNKPHFLPKAKSIIFLYMDGGVSQVDSFDPKPRLIKEHGQNPYDKFKVDNTQFGNVGKILKSPWDFKQYGESGIWVSDLFPHIATCVDDIAVVRSMMSNFPEHTNANYFLHTGSGIQGRPSMGAWINYGLGSMNENLPGYVVLDGGLTPPGGLDNFKNGFLPASYQASILKPRKIPVANIVPQEQSENLQKIKLKHLERLDKSLLGKVLQSDQIDAAIDNYELAFNMQSSLPELTDLSAESETTKKLYGLDSDDKNCQIYGKQCLLARRLVERGVRFIELTCPKNRFDRWDQHAQLKAGHEMNAHAVDQPIAALLKDLKSRGMLEDTLVVFAGEFGRTPFAQGTDGRDHNPSAFSIWLAGAGIKGGTTYGTTDEYGYRVVDKPTSIHDLHATMLHLLGVDHEQQTYRFGGRDIRLTDVHGHVINDILV
jgi:hypothetical protein